MRNWLHFFLAFDFSRFCVIIRIFIPATTANDLRLRRISIPDFIHYIFCPIFIIQKEPVFPFLMLSAKQESNWNHFYNVFDMTRSLTGDWTWDLPHSKPVLYHKEAVVTWPESITRIDRNNKSCAGNILSFQNVNCCHPSSIYVGLYSIVG